MASQISIAATDASKAEGNSGLTPFIFTITRTGDLTLAQSVTWTVAGSGTNPASAADFSGNTLPTGTVSFAAGQSSKTVTVNVAGDMTVENDEGFTVGLSSPTNGATLGTASANGTILNDDAGSVTITDVTVLEGAAGTTTQAIFTVTRSGGAAPFILNYTTAAGSFSGTAVPATAGIDYVPTSGTLTFGAGVNTQSFAVTVIGNSTVEYTSKDFDVGISQGSGGNAVTFTRHGAQGTIMEDDLKVVVPATILGVTEGNSGSTAVNFNLTAAYGVYVPHTVHWAVTGSGANPVTASDFAGGVLPSGDITNFVGGTASGVFYVAGDTVPEANKGFTITFSSTDGNVTFDGTTTEKGVIVDDDSPTAATVFSLVGPTDTSQPEGGLSGYGLPTGTVFGYGIERNGDISTAETVTYTVTGSGAHPASAADFSTGFGNKSYPTATIQFAAGQAFASFQILTDEDSVTEPDESFTVTLSNPSGGATLGTATSTGTILNDDPVVASDFNADGKSDILFQNDNGAAVIWQTDGASVISRTSATFNPGPTWKIVGSGDFDDDGKTDILLQNDNGKAAIWFMDGPRIVATSVPTSDPGPTWHIKGAGDFNGDGYSDILWQNDNGGVVVWTMNGGSITAITTIATNPGPTWHVITTGDFNNDGKSDIVLQNDSGQVAVWAMNGGTIATNSIVATNPGPTWHVEATGDFNNDGKSDIVLQNDDGEVAIWLMNGSTITSKTFLQNTSGWQVKGTGDYNGDGKTDILLQNSNGQAAVWLMNGTNLTSNNPIGTSPGASWHVIAG